MSINNMGSIQAYLQTRARQVEEALKGSLPVQWEFPADLRESMLYSLMAGGKRIRPVLVLAAAESFGLAPEKAMPVACAIEMIHTYSLIHDDLPAMDDDDYRRGKPTNHKKFGEAMAILAGDALLTHAFYSVTQAARQGGFSAEQVLAVVEEISVYAGARGMVGGQAADMQGVQGITRLEELEYIHARKTSDLIICSLRAGAILGGADEKQLRALTVFGSCIGMAFQIMDDILDVAGDEAKLGKPVKSDEKQEKVTYPYFIGLKASRDKVKGLTEQGKQALLETNLSNPEYLIGIADYLLQRDR
jgi:geranylgeranyl diphosphate synthase, type II